MEVMNRLCIAAGLSLALVSAAQNPAPSIECDKSKPQCAKPEDTQQHPKSTAEKFPFPGENSSGQQTPPAPDATTPQSTRERFPFPTDQSQQAPSPQDEPQQPSTSSQPDFSHPPADDASSSSSSSSQEEPAPTTQSDDAPIKAAPLPNYGTRRSKAEQQTRLRNEENRVPDDLKVAKFYTNDGNYAGAYLRYKDAVEHDPEQSEAHFGWAESAEKLGKLDEARQHYAEYLRLEPDGDHTRAAQRALEHLNAQAAKSDKKAGKH